ncbi:hypothetical protein MRX96_030728 [Rhipicephalus microplus]
MLRSLLMDGRTRPTPALFPPAAASAAATHPYELLSESAPARPFTAMNLYATAAGQWNACLSASPRSVLHPSR